MMMTGGLSEAQDATAEVQAICDAIRGELEGKAGRQFAEFTAVLVSRQVVAGTNYFVKVHVGNEEYIHVRIFQPLPGQGELQVHSHQANKTKDDLLTHF